MNLNETFLAEMNRCAAGGPRLVTVGGEGRRIRCELEKSDALACTFKRFALETDALARASIDRLQQIGQTLASRLTYLLEPIGSIEIDRQRCVLQMRSSPPHKGDEGTRYYELLICRGGELTLCRYHQHADHQRQVIPTTVTKEVLRKLVDDLLAAFD
jgi:hypothetical protein